MFVKENPDRKKKKKNVTYQIHLWNSRHFQGNQLVYHHVMTDPMPLMMLQFGQQDQLRNEDYEKAFTLIKLLLMSSFAASQFSTIFSKTDVR